VATECACHAVACTLRRPTLYRRARLAPSLVEQAGSGGESECSSSVAALHGDCLTGIQPHADLERQIGVLFPSVTERCLQFEDGAQCVASRQKHTQCLIAAQFEDKPLYAGLTYNSHSVGCAAAVARSSARSASSPE